MFRLGSCFLLPGRLKNLGRCAYSFGELFEKSNCVITQVTKGQDDAGIAVFLEFPEDITGPNPPPMPNNIASLNGFPVWGALTP